MILKRILSLLTAAALLTASFAVDAVSTETAETNPLPAAPVEFTDTAGHWAIGAIERWSELGIIIGESDGRFRPDDPVTRAEMAIILQRVLRYKTVSEERFADLTVDSIVEGGQTMNPSIEDLSAAIEKAHAKNVFVLPNNGNVILELLIFSLRNIVSLANKMIITLPHLFLILMQVILMRLKKQHLL